MSATERNAWFVLAVVAATVGTFVIATLLWHSALASTATLYVIVLAGALPLLPKPKSSTVLCDERDGEIGRKAMMAAFVAIWITIWVLPSMVCGSGGWRHVLSVPVWMLFQVQLWIVVLIATVWSVTTIRLYRRVQ